jgi:hypothetical protein
MRILITEEQIMPFSKSEADKINGLIESFKGGYTTLTIEQVELARKASMGDFILEFGLSVDEARKFINCVELSERQHKAVGFRTKPLEESRKRKKAGKLTESRLRQIVLHECSCMMGKDEEVGDIVPVLMKKVIDRLGSEEEHSGYHPMPEGEGLRFEDSDPHEEAGMIKSNLYSITTKAQSLHDMVGDSDDLPEWVQEKIAVCDEYMDVIHDYLKYEYKRGR